jgi:hypothetical protein
MNKLGQESGPALRSLAQDLPGLIGLLADLASHLNAVGDAWEGSIGQWLADRNVSNLANVLQPILFPTSLTDGQVRVNQMRRAQQIEAGVSPIQQSYINGTYMVY